MYNPQNPSQNPYQLDPSSVASGGMHGYGTDSGVGAGAPPLTSSGMSGWEKAGVAGLGGLGALGLGSMLGGGGGSFDTGGAESYLSQIPDVLKKYFEPYQEMLDPTTKLKELGGGFQSSPGYQFQLSQALKAGGQAAASGGMAGSPMQQQQAQQTATGLANQDYYNYLNKAMGMYQTGAEGYRGLGEDLSSNLMSQAQLQELQQQEEAREREQKSSNVWGSIGQIGGAIASHLL